MKKKHIITAVAVATAIATSIALSQTGHVAPDALYPTPSLTQGKADTLSLSDLTSVYSCQNGTTYSQCHRNVPPQEHQQVYTEYNVPTLEQNIQHGEIDHFYPLCAGGSNDIANLWYQPISAVWKGEDWGFKRKDKLETWVCQQVKAGAITPQDAYTGITGDWVAYYLKNRAAIEGAPQTFGGIGDDLDGDL